jgi:hypothetical protein
MSINRAVGAVSDFVRLFSSGDIAQDAVAIIWAVFALAVACLFLGA